jgi:hypothetical protein
MINTIPTLLAERNFQFFILLAVVAVVVTAGALAYRAVPARWRGVALVGLGIVAAAAQVAVIVQ